MIQKIDFHINELDSMKKYPNELFYIGNTSLIEKKKISIVGTRKPTQYTREFTSKITQAISNAGICIVSGAAMGVDAIAHQAANYDNTIAVVANGLDIKYPAVNKNIISSIEQNGLVLSSYKTGTKATRYSFVHRNEIVVALGECLIVTQADENSGSLRSVEYALKMGKTIYTIPHRIGDSTGTNNLLEKGLAKPIYSIDKFLEELGLNNQSQIKEDPFLEFCQTNPSYDEVVAQFQDKVFEYELLGKIKIENGKVILQNS